MLQMVDCRQLNSEVSGIELRLAPGRIDSRHGDPPVRCDEDLAHRRGLDLPDRVPAGQQVHPLIVGSAESRREVAPPGVPAVHQDVHVIQDGRTERKPPSGSWVSGLKQAGHPRVHPWNQITNREPGPLAALRGSRA